MAEGEGTVSGPWLKTNQSTNGWGGRGGGRHRKGNNGLYHGEKGKKYIFALQSVILQKTDLSNEESFDFSNDVWPNIFIVIKVLYFLFFFTGCLLSWL
jgi:hypothetical protein